MILEFWRWIKIYQIYAFRMHCNGAAAQCERTLTNVDKSIPPHYPLVSFYSKMNILLMNSAIRYHSNFILMFLTVIQMVEHLAQTPVWISSRDKVAQVVHSPSTPDVHQQQPLPLRIQATITTNHLSTFQLAARCQLQVSKYQSKNTTLDIVGIINNDVHLYHVDMACITH